MALLGERWVLRVGSKVVLNKLIMNPRRFNNNVKCFQVGDPESLNITVDACKTFLKQEDSYGT